MNGGNSGGSVSTFTIYLFPSVLGKAKALFPPAKEQLDLLNMISTQSMQKTKNTAGFTWWRSL